jgi:hypothetical protein
MEIDVVQLDVKLQIFRRDIINQFETLKCKLRTLKLSEHVDYPAPEI